MAGTSGGRELPGKGNATTTLIALTVLLARDILKILIRGVLDAVSSVTLLPKMIRCRHIQIQLVKTVATNLVMSAILAYFRPLIDSVPARHDRFRSRTVLFIYTLISNCSGCAVEPPTHPRRPNQPPLRRFSGQVPDFIRSITESVYWTIVLHLNMVVILGVNVFILKGKFRGTQFFLMSLTSSFYIREASSWSGRSPSIQALIYEFEASWIYFLGFGSVLASVYHFGISQQDSLVYILTYIVISLMIPLQIHQSMTLKPINLLSYSTTLTDTTNMVNQQIATRINFIKSRIAPAKQIAHLTALFSFKYGLILIHQFPSISIVTNIANRLILMALPERKTAINKDDSTKTKQRNNDENDRNNETENSFTVVDSQFTHPSIIAG